MTAAFRLGRIARSLGIVAIFAIVGPIVVTAVFGALVAVIGVPMLQIVLDLVELETIRVWLSVAVFLLLFFTLAAAALPSIVAGLVFAVAALYCGMNSLWSALVIMVAVVLGVVGLGFFVSPSESSPLLLPSVKGVSQGAFLALFLSIPAAIAASLCWLISRPLHRTP